jgi:DNA-binding transcriptional LysR family regulator
MDLRQLTYFLAVAEDLHFRRAAARLHIAQPAISEQIRKLEAELGTPLFIRASRRVELTAAGLSLQRDGARIVRQLEDARRSAREAGAGHRARLRIGVTTHGLPPAVVRTLGRLRTARRELHVELTTGAARALVEDVRVGHLDAAVTFLPAPTRGLHVVALGFERAAVALPSSEGGVPARSIAIEQLAGLRVLVLRRDIDPAFHDAVLVAAVRRGVELVESTAATVDQLLLEVSVGGGAAVLPRASADRVIAPGLDVRPFADLSIGARVGVVTREELHPAPLTTLLDELQVTTTRSRDVDALPAVG